MPSIRRRENSCKKIGLVFQYMMVPTLIATQEDKDKNKQSTSWKISEPKNLHIKHFSHRIYDTTREQT